MQSSRHWTWSSTGAIICARLLPRQGNSLAHVARLIDEYLVESLGDKVLAEACKLGASTVDLDFLLSRTVPNWTAVVTAAARGGHVHVFQWMAELQDSCGPWERDYSDAMKETACYGHLEVVKWLHERGFDLSHWSPLGEAIANGHLAMIAAQNGHPATVRWIHKNVKDIDMSYATAGAARNGDLDLLRWLHQQKRCSEAWLPDAMDAAVIGGHFHVVEWLFENGSKVCSHYATHEAAKAGNLPMLQWLHEHYNDLLDLDVMDAAAWEGHLVVIKWLHEDRSEGCTFAMDVAAGEGHFEVLQWLHDNRTEGCSAWAMDYAAQTGQLDIVKWLHENRSEGCTEAAMSEAARNGHVDVLQWLVEHYPDKCRDDLMTIAAWEGHLDIVRYLDEHTKQRASRWGLGDAAKQGRLTTLLMLMQIHSNPEGGARGRSIIHAAGKAYDEMLTQLSSQHATPVSSLWAKALETLEHFHRSGFYSSVSRMLERALRRGFPPLAQQFMGKRGATEKRKYVTAAIRRRNGVFLRWMLRNGTPIDKSSVIELAIEYSPVGYPRYIYYAEVAGYLSERDRAQLVCEAVRKKKWSKLLRWMLDNTSFNDDSSRVAIHNAIKQAPSDTVQWIRDCFPAQRLVSGAISSSSVRRSGNANELGQSWIADLLSEEAPMHAASEM